MKWTYGKQDWKLTACGKSQAPSEEGCARGLENCYLMTNGLGGFSSLTMTGAAARNDHAFLMACAQAPNHRYNLVHRLKEELILAERDGGGESVEPGAGAGADIGERAGADAGTEPGAGTGRETRRILSTQEFAGREPETGCRYLSFFSWEDTPVWRFLADGVEIVKEAGMEHGSNRAALRYEITNRSRKMATLRVTPFYQFVPKGKDMEADQRIVSAPSGRIRAEGAAPGCPELYLRTNGERESIPRVQETLYYRYDACDGRRETGRTQTDHRICMTVPAGKIRTLEIVFETEPSDRSAGRILTDMKERRKTLRQRAHFLSETAGALAAAADQFVSGRDSTRGETILAGYPVFEDWGRDPMIALPGVCLSTGRYETAKSILRTFAVNERDGLMPNLFPEGGNEPMYNTADAALLFINCVYLYYRKTRDAAFVKEMYPVMERIVTGYRQGTRFGIHMDDDGLIAAGQGLDQVTWMDVRVGDILPTPRHGKPVEINAYWYNALRIMAEFAKPAGRDAEAYETLADRVRASFIREFWMEEKHCLRDVVSGTAADAQIRCNQIWALSLPFTMLEEEKEQQILDTVYEKLYTPYGLRTLDPADPEFRPEYGGEVLKRDLAYHQGTVWVYPLGAYYLAYLRINGYSEDAKQYVCAQLEVLHSALREGCIGQLPEIYDGLEPVSSKGCFAQAWSVGELLRVYEALER